jgi:hypothetical protein
MRFVFLLSCTCSKDVGVITSCSAALAALDLAGIAACVLGRVLQSTLLLYRVLVAVAPAGAYLLLRFAALGLATVTVLLDWQF